MHLSHLLRNIGNKKDVKVFIGAYRGGEQGDRTKVTGRDLRER